MRIGTKSLLFGAHQFVIHPYYVAKAWVYLYGWSWDPRLWLCFLVHDWGYWGKPNMDGKEGEDHVFLGAGIMSLFGKHWEEFCIAHSRHQCHKFELPISRLAIADKMAIALTPRWLYRRLTTWTGEIDEYRAAAKHRAELEYLGDQGTEDAWLDDMRKHFYQWAMSNFKDIAQTNDRLLRRGPRG